MTDWIKAIQSVGRGFRPGMEVQMISAGTGVGKSVIMDFESDDFTDWEHVMRPHYVETAVWGEVGEVAWYKFSRKPKLAIIYSATKVIRHNEDGSFEYIKNRTGTGVKVLDAEEEKEMTWIILKARSMD